MKFKYKREFFVSLMILTVLLSAFGCANKQDSMSKADSEFAQNAATESAEGKADREDYLEAGRAIAKDYIYLEKNLGMSREAFLSEIETYAQKITWTGDKAQLIAEIRLLMARFKDGHMNWSLPEAYRVSETMTLGFAAEGGVDDSVVIQKVYLPEIDGLVAGDVITSWNGEPIESEIERILSLTSYSSEDSGRERAIRRLGVDLEFMPLRTDYSPVTIGIKRVSGEEEKVTLKWTPCSTSAVYDEAIESKVGPMVFMTSSQIPSLEEIPEDCEYVSPSLLYYTREVFGETVAVLHPRDFYSWSEDELDETLKRIRQKKATVLFLDLKDTAEGSFDHVLYLAHALSVVKPFPFEYDMIDAQTHERHQGRGNFAEIESEIDIKYPWSEKVVIRTNPIVQSEGDYFVRWMQLNNEDHRFLFVGKATAGAGGGTDTYILQNSKIEIQIPLIDRKIAGDKTGIEGFPVLPDVETRASVESIMNSEYLKKHAGFAFRRLVKSDDLKLKISEADADAFEATDKFTKRVMEALKEAYPLKTAPLAFEAEVTLKFNGYSDMEVDLKQGICRFADEKNYYDISDFCNSLWGRRIMEIRQGKVAYTGFMEDILYKNYVNRDRDQEVILYYDGDIRLRFGMSEVSVLKWVNESAIESEVPSNSMHTEVYLLDKEPYDQIVVSLRYDGTNGYGSMAWLQSYEIREGGLVRGFDFGEIMNQPVEVVSYEAGKMTFEVTGIEQRFDVDLTEEEIQQVDAYEKVLAEIGHRLEDEKDYVFLSNLRECAYGDFNADGKSEMIAVVNMRGGAAGISEVLYFDIELEPEIKIIKVTPRRETPETEVIIQNQNK